MSRGSLEEIASVLSSYAEGDFSRRLPAAGDAMEGVRHAVNGLGAALEESRLVDADFDALLDQLMAIGSLDLDHRVPMDRGTPSYRALAMGLNMLTEELESVLRSLAAAEERYRTAFMMAPIGMAMANEVGEGLRVNPAFARWLGYSYEDFPFDRWQDVTHPDHIAEGDSLVGPLLRGEIPKVELEKRYLTADGEALWARTSVVAVRDEQGRFLHTLAQVVDIHELKTTMDALRHARDRAQEADRLKTEFLRNMSHEIRTPMTSILGMTELAIDTDSDAARREYLDVARVAGHSLLGLVDDLLNLSRIEAGRQEPSVAPVSPAEVIRNAIRPLGAQAQAAGLGFELTIADRVPPLVMVDGGWVSQIVTNLVGNAVKFTDSGEIRVGVDVTPDAATLVVTVADTGIGIPEDRRGIIFDPFRQADGTTSRSYGGTGLGLAISQRLAALMGGRIWLDDAGAAGSTFHVELPVAAADDAGGMPVEPQGPLPSPAGRALVAEDHDANRRLICHMLERLGYEVVAVASGDAAVAAAQEAPFAVLLVDLQMPGMDGLEAIAAIRAKESAASRVPILAVTAYALEDDRRLSLAAGADGFLPKPFTANTLAAALGGIMSAAPS